MFRQGHFSRALEHFEQTITLDTIRSVWPTLSFTMNFFISSGASPIGRGNAPTQSSPGQHFYDAELHRVRANILFDLDGTAIDEAEALFDNSA